MIKKIFLVFSVLIFLTGCLLVKSNKKVECPTYSYDVVEGDSIRYEKKCCK